MWCFYYLLKITTIAIIKANAITVIPTNPQNNKYIIKINTREQNKIIEKIKLGLNIFYYLLFFHPSISARFIAPYKFERI